MPHLPYLYKDLKDPNFAAGYLSLCLEDSPRIFLIALKNVVESRGGFTKVAKKLSVSREHLYRMLSKDGNPRFSSLLELLEVLEIKLSLRHDDKKAA